tara:strand:- start:2105 stop:2365 length:261 start_codon:yes stop_codon:yes gene_type:complete
MSYLVFFPDFPPLTHPVPMGFRDVTSASDLTPRFSDAVSGLELHIHHPDPTKRDLPSAPQFLLIHAASGHVIFETDDWAALARMVI